VKSNPWTDRFDHIDEHQIRLKFENRPMPLDPKLASNKAALFSGLRDAYSQLAIATPRIIDLYTVLVTRCAAHAHSAYADPSNFLKQCYRKDGPLMPEENFPICLTGPAGIGKSTLLKRLPLVLPHTTTLSVDAGHKIFPLVSCWYLSIKNARTKSAMLRQLIQGAGHTPSGKSIEALIHQCRVIAYQTGVCMISVDELQFLTMSKDATAKIFDAVSELTGIGVPITLATNYSLVYKLKRRAHEDKQRILGESKVLYQDAADSDEWKQTVDGFREVAPWLFRFGAHDDSEYYAQLHSFTAGTRRLISKLILTALSLEKRSSPSIGLDQIFAAYMSPEFSVNREDVELMNQQFMTGKKVRDDLWCPVNIPKEISGQLAKSAEETGDANMAASMLENSLTPQQRELWSRLKVEAQGTDADSKIVPIGKNAVPTLDDFEVGESILAKLRKKK